MSTAVFRVMTYNVHSCRGVDGRIDPDRIAAVIEEFNPDIVALQELDVNRKKTGNIDQPLHITEHLRMHSHFQPAVAIEGEHYGIAVMSRHPFDIVRAEHLPSLYPEDAWHTRMPIVNYLYEPREAIWASVNVNGRKIHFFNTHLALRAAERKIQVEELLSSKWLGSTYREDPVILCGDLNSGPKSFVYKQLSNQMREVKSGLDRQHWRKTFFSHCPLFELDHIFYKGKIQIVSASVCVTPQTRRASDHFPVIADFQWAD